MKHLYLVLALSLSISAFAQRITEVIKVVDPSVFKIITYDTWGLPSGTGTGFYSGPSGRAITNWHVLSETAQAYVVELDGTILPIVEVTKGCEECDLIEFRVDLPEGANRPALKFQEGAVQKGDDIFILGCPEGYQNFVSKGLVSAFTKVEGETMIQTEASISAGSSGSPVMTLDGKVIGVATSSREGGQNLNFVTPITAVERFVPIRPGADALLGSQQDIFVYHERSADTPNLMLHAIETKREKTTVRMSYSNTNLFFGDGAYIFTNTTDPEKSFRLTNRKSGKEYKIISSSLGESPSNPTFLQLGETVFFELVFPPLTEAGGLFDLTEGMEGGNWSFSQLSLDPPAGLKIENTDDVDQLEAMWNLMLTSDDIENIGEEYQFNYLEYILADMELSAFENNLAGVIAFLSSNDGNARMYFEEAIRQAPMYDDPWVNLYMLVPDDDPEQEMEYITGLVRAEPNMPEYMRLRAKTLSNLERHSEAVEEYKKLLETDRSSYEDLIFYGFSMLQAGDVNGCAAVVDGLNWYRQEEDFDPEYDQVIKDVLGQWCGKKFLKASGL